MSYSLVNLWELSDHKLFSDIKLPSKVDKEILINTIFDEAGELEPVTSNVTLFTAKINNFFSKNYDNFLHMADALALDYEPIENYDRKSEIVTTDAMTNINQVSAYDSDKFQNNAQDTSSDTNVRTERTHGNIGVTTSQQMLESELKLRGQYNIYDIITGRFIEYLTVNIL